MYQEAKRPIESKVIETTRSVPPPTTLCKGKNLVDMSDSVLVWLTTRIDDYSNLAVSVSLGEDLRCVSECE